MRISAVVLLSSLLAGRIAHADDAAGPVAPAPGNWYGWQVLGADAVALSVLVASQTGLVPDRFAALGVGGYLLDGVVIHAVHHRPRSAMLSVGLRLLGPIAGLAVGFVAAGSFCPDPPPSGDVLSFAPCDEKVIGYVTLAGMAAASIVDAALATEVHDGSEWQPTRSAAPAVSPYLASDRGGGRVGLIARF